jgi:hypothetical protein
MLDTSRARERFGFEARTGFEEGLRRTIAWYVATLADAPARRRRPTRPAGAAPDDRASELTEHRRAA